MKRVLIVVVAMLGLLPVWSAEALTVQLGDQDLVSGTFHVSGDLTSTAAGDPAFFNSPCGSDSALNCSLSWALPAFSTSGQTITGATLTLGILDHDSAAAGDQVALYTLNGNDLTASLNTQFESFGGVSGKFCTGPNGPNTVFCSEYDVYTVTVPIAAVSSPATVVLALQGPGIGVLGPTAFNGAFIDFSRLDITTIPNETNVPEPATVALLAAGLSGFVARRLSRRISGASSLMA